LTAASSSANQKPIPVTRTAPSRPAEIALAPPLVESRETPDGGRLLSSPVPLEPYESNVGEMLRRWAAEDPQRAFLAERDEGGNWRYVTFGEAWESAMSVAQALLDRGLGPERPLMILSGNAIDHALVMLGGFLAGTPVAPVSVAYSLLSEDFGKLRHIARLVRPSVVYAADGEAFERPLTTVDFGGAEIVVSKGEPDGGMVTPLRELLSLRPTSAVEEAQAAVGPDSVAKILFTSGSTGMPKGVINTHRMLCSNQQALAQIWPFTAETPPVLVDWLPWNHTFGGNHNFNLVLKRGGTLHIDGGRPTPEQIDVTLRNLREVSPTIHFNVPVGWGQLAGRLEEEAQLRESFFARLQVIFYAGAALPQDVWDRLERLCREVRGERLLMTSSWGLTETAPIATAAHFPSERSGNIGIPVPGVTIKMVPSGDKQELRLKGPNVTPGYFGQPELTAEAFDDEGFYRTGDAGRLVDPNDPSKGLFFDGRTVEDFKLASGTFVQVGRVRVAALAAASPALQDAAVTGHDREYVGLLAWPNLDGVRQLAGEDAARDAATAASSDSVVEHVRERLREYNSGQRGSSTRIGRVLLMDELPSLDANEVTDKGYINQRAVLQRRAPLVEQLYAEPPGERVIDLS
jgi:feruloyl-CoA synthase